MGVRVHPLPTRGHPAIKAHLLLALKDDLGNHRYQILFATSLCCLQRESRLVAFVSVVVRSIEDSEVDPVKMLTRVDLKHEDPLFGDHSVQTLFEE